MNSLMWVDSTSYRRICSHCYVFTSSTQCFLLILPSSISFVITVMYVCVIREWLVFQVTIFSCWIYSISTPYVHVQPFIWWFIHVFVYQFLNSSHFFNFSFIHLPFDTIVILCIVQLQSIQWYASGWQSCWLCWNHFLATLVIIWILTLWW